MSACLKEKFGLILKWLAFKGEVIKQPTIEIEWFIPRKKKHFWFLQQILVNALFSHNNVIHFFCVSNQNKIDTNLMKFKF